MFGLALGVCVLCGCDFHLAALTRPGAGTHWQRNSFHPPVVRSPCSPLSRAQNTHHGKENYFTPGVIFIYLFIFIIIIIIYLYIYLLLFFFFGGGGGAGELG